MAFQKKLFVLCMVLYYFNLFNPCLIIAQQPVINDEKGETLSPEPRMQIDVSRLDYGIIPSGHKVSKRLEIVNIGKDILKWHGFVSKENGHPGRLGRFIGLMNDEIKGSGTYKVPSSYRDVIELSGNWLESDGVPVLNVRSVMKYHFSGTGLRIFFWKEPIVGRYSIYMDQNFITEIDVQSQKKERADLLVAENLPAGQHTLTIVGKEGKASLEGFEIYGKTATRGPVGWITIMPVSGDTTREIDYVSIIMNTQKMNSGLYAEVITFSSNGGSINIPVSVEVANDNMQRVIDVFRYSAGNNYLFTANAQLDESLILNRRYVKEGIAFRLFQQGTPGTVEFYRWYNPSRGSHFYSHNKNEAARIEREYVLDGSIGNIATTRLRNTRELYRWFNPQIGFYFYSMDIRGDGIQKKGYRFDGIAGYVK